MCACLATLARCDSRKLRYRIFFEEGEPWYKAMDVILPDNKMCYTVHEITVGHRTFSEHLRHLAEQKSLCSALLSERGPARTQLKGVVPHNGQGVSSA